MTLPQALAHDVIVLAGGFGTRLREVVADVPKPMAPVAGRPFLDHLLHRLALQGASRVILSVGHMAHLIEDRYGAGFAGLDITCVREDHPLGTGGGIREALAAAGTQWVLVLNGDTWLDMPYGDFLAQVEQAHVPMGMVTRWVDDAARYGRCIVEGHHVVVFGEKSGTGPGLINAGVYALRRDLFKPFELPESFSFETDFVAKHLSELRPFAYRSDGYFIDIGVPEDYRRAQAELPAQVPTP
jgi:D-glycero-alpha-D-manno-heptose 1-phosphate guanylyltransferase